MGVDRGEKGCECVQDLSSQSGNDPDTVLKRDLVMRDNDVDVRDGEEETFFLLIWYCKTTCEFYNVVHSVLVLRMFVFCFDVSVDVSVKCIF